MEALGIDSFRPIPAADPTSRSAALRVDLE